MACCCKCSVALPHCAVGWSAVCDCGICWLYSLNLDTKWQVFFTEDVHIQNNDCLSCVDHKKDLEIRI